MAKETIVDSIPVMVAFINREGHHQFVNRRWQSTLGWPLEEMQQHKNIFAELYPDPEYRKYVLDYIKGAAGNWSDFKTRTRDGRVLDTNWINVKLSGGSIIGIGLDITERKIAEEVLAAESHQLEETNTALRVILQRREEDQKEIERKITTNIRKLVLPNIEKLRGLKLNDLQANCLDIVAANLQQVASPFLQNLAACFADFTPREIQVANMIRQGKTSKEIAAIFNSSIRSVDFHRDNIRKKLDLSNQ